MTNKETFLSICREDIKRDGIEDLLKWLEDSDFFAAPASTRFHGNYEGGLCEHSLNVHRELTRLNDIYQLGYSKETIAVTALFHDLCKVNYYKRGTRNVKDENGNWVVKEVYEVDARVPLGHGEKSCIILQWYIKLSLEELLAIRWHMGGFDSATKGADHDYMANAFRYFDAAAEQVGITLKGLQLAVKLSTPDGEEKDVSYEDWERMILNGIHNEDK